MNSMECECVNSEEIRGTFRLLGRAHMLEVLHHFAHNGGRPLRFRDLQSSLTASPNTLSARLKELTDAGFLTRTSHDTIPPHVEYHPTPRMEGLCQVFDAMHAWMKPSPLLEV